MQDQPIMRFVFFVIAAIAFIEQHNLLHIISADSFELCGSAVVVMGVILYFLRK